MTGCKRNKINFSASDHKGTQNSVVASRQIFKFLSQELFKYFLQSDFYEDGAKDMDKHLSSA
ncbi:hypothetical protein [Bartonella gabonensis]|uniref:hypothetical protein n=1 Tax=Bartonella gabonensis TaxID=2699889 RepID=UPI00158C1260|nr:hypothetical protein [Bartonella gabonensis]